MAMAKFTVDTSAKLFIAKAGVVEFDIKVDLYSDAKEHWLLGGPEMGFKFPFATVGGEAIDDAAGTKVPLYAFLVDGWRVRPDEANHTLKVTGGILLVDGGGDPFVDTLGAFTVRINYQQPVQAILAETGVSGLTSQEAADLSDVRMILRNKMVTDPDTGIMTLYDDGGNVLYTAAIFEDAAGVQAYRGQKAERRERLT